MGSSYLERQSTTLAEEFSVPKGDLPLLAEDAETFEKVGAHIIVNYEKVNKLKGPDLAPLHLREQILILYFFRETKISGFAVTSFKFGADGGNYSKIEEMNSQGTRRQKLERKIVDSLRQCLPGYVIRILPKKED